MSVKLNNSDNYESVTVFLNKNDHPQAFENKVQCLINSGLSREEAEQEVERIFSKGMEMEVYYETDFGMFTVEPEAVEAGTIHSPYTGDLCEDAEIDV